MLKRYLATAAIVVSICFPFSYAQATGISSIPAINSIILDEDKLLCAEANGLLWCRYLDKLVKPLAASCNEICASRGMVPVADDTAWLEAQNTEPKCEAVRDAVELSGASVDLDGYLYACAEYHTPTSRFLCSTVVPCPDNHRTGADGNPGNTSICPCE